MTEKHSTTIGEKNGDASISIVVTAGTESAKKALVTSARAFLKGFAEGDQRALDFDGGVTVRVAQIRADKRESDGSMDCTMSLEKVSAADAGTIKSYAASGDALELKLVPVRKKAVEKEESDFKPEPTVSKKRGRPAKMVMVS